LRAPRDLRVHDAELFELARVATHVALAVLLTCRDAAATSGRGKTIREGPIASRAEVTYKRKETKSKEHQKMVIDGRFD
jgi:hypothetical protein